MRSCRCNVAARVRAVKEKWHAPAEPGGNGRQQMVRLLKLVVVLGVLAFVGLVGYAYLGDLTPPVQEIRQPVAIDAG